MGSTCCYKQPLQMYLGSRSAKKQVVELVVPIYKFQYISHIVINNQCNSIADTGLQKKSSREASRPNKSASKEINPRQRKGNLGNAQPAFQTKP